MIRAIEQHEVESITFIGVEFWKEGNLPGSFDPAYAARRWREILASGTGRIFAYFKDSKPLGAIGIFIVEDINTRDRIAEEAFWFVRKEHRGIGLRLFRFAEQYAKASGCRRMAMVHLMGLHPDELRGLYERTGYRCVEHAYHKELT